MRRGWLSALLVCLPALAQAQSGKSSVVDTLIMAFSGRWSCEGKFSNGNPIAADVTFTPTLDNKWLIYEHQDRPPGRYKTHALWGYDPAAKGIVSAAADNGGGLRLFRAPGFDGTTLILERAALTDSVAHPERFTYRKGSDSTFRMTYEVRRGTSPWVMGDYIDCVRR